MPQGDDEDHLSEVEFGGETVDARGFILMSTPRSILESVEESPGARSRCSAGSEIIVVSITSARKVPDC